MSSIKKQILALTLSLGLLAATVPAARATSLLVDGTPVAAALLVCNATAYVPLRTITRMLCPDAVISWENGEAVVRTSRFTLNARPSDCYLEVNGRMLYIEDGVKVEDGVTLLPVRVLAKALGASVEWNGATDTVSVYAGSGTITSGEAFYDSSSVYWLSHIISAESGGESLKGKLAVGNVILNRVASPDFPNCIYDVIFDNRWGGQFEPVGNGTVYNAPSEESILAAKLCLEGASVVGNSIYFLNPARASNFWVTQNCRYIATIGSHQFYM